MAILYELDCLPWLMHNQVLLERIKCAIKDHVIMHLKFSMPSL